MPDKNIMAVPFDLLIMGAAVETGIINALEKRPMTAAELAAEITADQRAVWTVLEAMAALGYLTRQDHSYALSGDARNMIFTPGAPNYTGLSFMHRYELLKSWIHLPEVIATGKPHPRKRTPVTTAYFMAAMQEGARRSARPMAEFLLSGSPRNTRVLDIGGGPLFYARAFTALGATVTVLDLAEVVSMMGKEAAAAGIEMIAGDFNVALPEGPFDLAYLGNINHMVGEEENQELIRKTAGVIKPGGRIAIVEFVRGASPFAAVFGVNMLVNTGNGGTWTMEQFTGWLENSGFGDIRLDTVAERQVITATKK